MTGSHAAGPGAAEPGPERAASGTAPTRVVLVGWPGADWKLLNRLVDEGQLPAVRQFMTGGCIGTLSGGRGPSREAIWTSMATGMRAFDHGVLGPMALDDGAAEAGISLPRHRRVPAVWEILESRGLRSHLVGWPVTHGSAPARGCIVSEAFGHPELARTDSLLSDAVTPASFRGELEEQWMLGEELDAAVLREFFQQWSGLDQLPASWLSAGAGALAYTFSRQAAFTWLLENEPWDFAAVCLPAIEWLDKRLLRGLNSSEDPAAVQRYLRVLAATYRLLDQMLERIRALAGPEAVVLLVSPYGFGSGSVHQRVNRRLEQELGGGSYRGALGIFAAAGPRFAADKLINGVSGVDIAPTLLHLFGLPVGKDMEGRVLGELYDEAPEVSSIASWRGSTTGREKSPHDDVPGAVLPDTILRTLYEQFIALGVVERAAPPKNANAALLDRSLRWTLAKSYIDGHRPISALPLLEDLSAEEPENANFMLQLANCQLKLGMTDEAHAMLTVILEDYPDSALAHLCMAYLENRRRRFDQALAHLDAAEQGGASPGMLHAHRGYALLQMRRWDEALQVFGRAETAAPQDAAGPMGMARALLGLRRYGAAADAARRAIGADHRNTMAHYLNGIALMRQDLVDEAIASLEDALRLAPHVPRLHYQLLRLKRRRGDAPAELVTHQRAIAHRQAKASAAPELREAAARREKMRRRAREQDRGEALPVPAELEAKPLTDGHLPARLLAVTGLPLAGAGVVFDMLKAGGRQVLEDPALTIPGAGWMNVHEFVANPLLLGDLQGKAIKVPSLFLPLLPGLHYYKFIFVHRPIIDVARSQQLRLADGQFPGMSLDERVRLMTRHRNACITFLRRAPNITLLEIDFEELLADAPHCAARIDAFIDGDQKLNIERMAAIVEARRCSAIRTGHGLSEAS